MIGASLGMARGRLETVPERLKRLLGRLSGDQSNEARQVFFTGRVSGGGVCAKGSAVGHGGTLKSAVIPGWPKPGANYLDRLC
jgi:hypothetical protein